MTILIECEQGSTEWLQARSGACTASRFKDARSRINGLTEQQAAYVEAIKSGMPKEQAKAVAGYQKAPSAAGVERALAGLPVGEMSDTAIRYAQLLAIERIACEPLDSVFETFAMRRGRELEPVARRLYEEHTGDMITEAGLVLTDDGRFGYSTDGRVQGQRGRIEIKCPMAADKVAGVWLNPEPVIAEYIDQIDGGIWIECLEWIDLVVYTPWLESVGKELFIHRVYRDERRISALESDLLEFIRVVNDYEARLRGVEAAPISEPEHATATTTQAASTAPADLPESIF